MPEFAGVCVAPDMPPEPFCLAVYFSDILAVGVVISLDAVKGTRVDVANFVTRKKGAVDILIIGVFGGRVRNETLCSYTHCIWQVETACLLISCFQLNDDSHYDPLTSQWMRSW